MRHFDAAAEESATRLFAEAQEELISHLLRSNVIKVAPAMQRAWLEDTIAYLGDRYHRLPGAALRRLRALADGYLADGILREPERRPA